MVNQDKITVAITGSTGMVGECICQWFLKHNYNVIRFLRPTSMPKDNLQTIWWDPYKQSIDLENLEGTQVVINLAGENIASKRWSTEQKDIITKSRVITTSFLSNTLAKLKKKPAVFISASAVGYYNNKNFTEPQDEKSPAGDSFLANVAKEWEKATTPAKEVGIRVINLRIGAVLSKNGGMLNKILPIFKAGLGGKVGNGSQFLSWIAVDEIPLILDYIVHNRNLEGPLNCVAPNPVSNTQFTEMLGNILKKPTVFPLPAFAAKILLGDMAEELLLSGAKILPKVLIDSGYPFTYPTLDKALQHTIAS